MSYKFIPSKVNNSGKFLRVSTEGKLEWASSSGGGGGISYILNQKLTNDLSTTGNNALNNIPNFVFDYEANSTYRINLYGAISSASTQAGCGFAFDVSSAVTNVWLQFYHQLATGGTITGGSQVIDATSYAVTSGTPANNQIIPVYVTALINTSSNTGTAQLMFRSETTAIVTLKAHSILLVEKII
jgi:hypothetical protein